MFPTLHSLQLTFDSISSTGAGHSRLRAGLPRALGRSWVLALGPRPRCQRLPCMPWAPNLPTLDGPTTTQHCLDCVPHYNTYIFLRMTYGKKWNKKMSYRHIRVESWRKAYFSLSLSRDGPDGILDPGKSCPHDRERECIPRYQPGSSTLHPCSSCVASEISSASSIFPTLHIGLSEETTSR